ncbi:uncharacterized protein METZ01_LOCUS164264 [marine metagenome]|uniref:Uncharacterized protein n=1 Tax=marine metagenome TaxID=408172 RepID=A0A382BC53_9ZZZZ
METSGRVHPFFLDRWWVQAVSYEQEIPADIGKIVQPEVWDR